MKRLFVMLMLICLFSCSAEKGEQILSEFDATVSINVSGREHVARYEKRLSSDRLVFISPESLSGLCIELFGEECTVSFGDISFNSDEYRAVFDFLPIEGEGEKTVGNRTYKIYDIVLPFSRMEIK